MSDETNSLESSLHAQRAAELPPALLDRLEGAADGSLLELTAIETQWENELRRIRPSALRPSLLASLETATLHTPFPEPQAIIAFSKTHATPTHTTKRSWWSTAAAVAILGALGGLLIPTQTGPSQNTAHHTEEPTPALPQPGTPSITTLTPAEFSRKLSETSDEGVIWPSGRPPHRVLKVVYKDQVTMKREDGSTYQIEQPRVEYYIVPTESH